MWSFRDCRTLPPLDLRRPYAWKAGLAMIMGNPTVSIEAQPQSLKFHPDQTAVIVVDMQNDFGSEGGMFARAGIDISAIQAAVAPTARVLDTARRSGMP